MSSLRIRGNLRAESIKYPNDVARRERTGPAGRRRYALARPGNSGPEPSKTSRDVGLAKSGAGPYRGFLEAVVALGVIMKKPSLFIGTEVARNRVKGSVQRIEIAIELVDRKIAGEHASIDAKGIDGFEDERP